MLRAKQDADWTCVICGNYGGTIIGSHAFPRRVQDPTDASLIFPMCVRCDRQFDSIHSIPKRAQWLRDHGAYELADRMAKKDGRCEEEA